jgi:hypothetical protein
MIAKGTAGSEPNLTLFLGERFGWEPIDGTSGQPGRDL